MDKIPRTSSCSAIRCPQEAELEKISDAVEPSGVHRVVQRGRVRVRPAIEQRGEPAIE